MQENFIFSVLFSLKYAKLNQFVLFWSFFLLGIEVCIFFALEFRKFKKYFTAPIKVDSYREKIFFWKYNLTCRKSCTHKIILDFLPLENVINFIF